MNQEVKENTPTKYQGWKLTFFAVEEVSIISTEIGSFRGIADGGSVGVESSAWDSSPTPKLDWDAMLDNYEKKGIRKLNIGSRKI